MAITVNMSAPYLSLEHLVSAIAAGVAEASRGSDRLTNRQEIRAAAALTWEARLRELAGARAIKGHRWETFAAEDWALLDIERDVFFVDDLNACPQLTREGLRFVVVESERVQSEFTAGFSESVLNGNPIDWLRWVEQMPSLSAGEAARLMAGLEPDLYRDLSARPVPKNNVQDDCQHAAVVERLAEREGKQRDTAAGWLAWAKERAFKVHPGFELAVADKTAREYAAGALAALPEKEARHWHEAPKHGDGRRLVTYRHAGLESTSSATLEDFIEEVTERLARWKQGRYAVIEAAQVLADAAPGVDGPSLCRQMEAAIHAGELKFRKNGVPVPASLVPAGRLWPDFVEEADVNEWLAATGARYRLTYPYQAGATPQEFIPLLEVLAPFFGMSLADLPPHIAARVREEYAGDLPWQWDSLEPAQRRDLAYQKDQQADPALKARRDWYRQRAERQLDIQRRIQVVKSKETVGFADYERQQQMLRALEQQLQQEHAARWPGVQETAEEAEEPQSAKPAQAVVPTDEEWKDLARARALAIIKRQRERDLYPSQSDIADEIAREFRAQGVVGADGKPLSGGTIKRHALAGISSAQGKHVSTAPGRGK